MSAFVIRAVWGIACLCSLDLAHSQTAPAGSVAAPAPASESFTTPAPILFVIDAANTLHSYGADGQSLQETPVDRQRALLNGGAVFAMGKVYLTFESRAGSEPLSGIVAFNAATLNPLLLRRGAFKAPDAGDTGRITGLAFDSTASEFYLATERLGAMVFDRTGKYLRRTPETKVDVAGIAFDSGQSGLWGVTGRRAVVRFGQADSTPAPIKLKARLKQRAQQPVAVALCRSDARGASSAALVVLFNSAARRAAVGAARAFDLTGVPIGAVFEGEMLNPHGVACTAHGEVFIAADNGLLAYGLDGHRRSPPGALATLRMPILGVAAIQ